MPDGIVGTSAGSKRPQASLLLLTLVIMSSAVSLRAVVTSVGALLRHIQADIFMSDTTAGVLTMLPALCFGVFGLLSVRVGGRVDSDRVLFAALLLITLGLLARSFAPNPTWLIVASLIALVGTSVANVVIPVVVRTWFPASVGRMTGLYSMALLVGTAVPAALSVPIAEFGGSWRIGIGFWAAPSALALIPWLLLFRRRPPRFRPAGDQMFDGLVGTVRRSPQAWALTAFFGIQALEAYVVAGWLASIFQDSGLSASRAGALLAIALGVGAPLSLVIGRRIAANADQRSSVVVLGMASAAAYGGLLFAPATAPLLWSVILGIGLGAFPLSLALVGARACTPRGTAELASLVQGGGYLIASLGPLSVGRLHDLTGVWTIPLWTLLLLLIPKILTGVIAAAPGCLDDDYLVVVSRFEED